MNPSYFVETSTLLHDSSSLPPAMHCVLAAGVGDDSTLFGIQRSKRTGPEPVAANVCAGK